MKENPIRWLLLAGCLLALMTPGPAHAQPSRARPPADNVKPGKPHPGDGAPERIHRLESVTWDAAKCELTWVVSTGTKTGNRYIPAEEQRYTIDMDISIMQVGAERRRFDIEEAESVHRLMDIISSYAASSTIWWEDGEGERVDSDGGPVADHRRTDDLRMNGKHLTLVISTTHAGDDAKKAPPTR